MAASALTNSRRRSRIGLDGVPVFMYHGVACDDTVQAGEPGAKYWVRRSQLLDQLEEARRRGYETCTLAALWGRGNRENDCLPGGRRTLVLTFDDGRATDYNVAYPLLLATGVRADFFVNTSTISQRGFLTWGQIVEMQRFGMSFHSHAHDHIYLARLGDAALEYQLEHSKALLEDRLGTAVEFLAVPYGEVSRRVIRVALRLGYRAVCTSLDWPARPGATTVNRTVIYGDTGLSEFCRLLGGHPLPYAARIARSALLYLPKRVLLSFRASWFGRRVAAEQA